METLDNTLRRLGAPVTRLNGLNGTIRAPAAPEGRVRYRYRSERGKKLVKITDEDAALLMLAGEHMSIEWTCISCHTGKRSEYCGLCGGTDTYTVYYPNGAVDNGGWK